jgi:hypothetical protein
VNRRQLRARAKTILRALGLQPPLDILLLCQRLGEQRGRPIKTVAMETSVGARKFGFLYDDPTAAAALILYEKNTTKTHQDMIILHELAHVMLDHPDQAVDHSYRAAFAAEFQTISPTAIAEILGHKPPSRRQKKRSEGTFGRSVYDDPIEWEAEMMATIMWGWTPESGAYYPPPPKNTLEAILGDNPAW